MSEDFNLPHWNIRDPLPSSQAKGFDNALSGLTDQIHENFEELVGQTAKRLRAMSVQPPTEALGEVTTTSGSYVSLTGGPSITVACRPGLMIAVLTDVEMKVTGGHSVATVEVDGSAAYVCGSQTASATYVRTLSSTVDGGLAGITDFLGFTYPAGSLAVFPATATSHTLEVKYLSHDAVSTASFQNRRLWAWVL